MKDKLNFEPRWFVVIVFFCVGIFLGVISLYILIFNRSDNFGLQKIHPAKSLYKFINPLLAVDSNEKKEFLENKSSKVKINNIFLQKEKSFDIAKAAVYFRELEGGKWFGINHNIKFSPGIFLKIPIMISYFKSSENDADFLKKTLTYTKILHSDKFNYGTAANSDFIHGEAYTVKELIRAMIIDDDDNAANVLFENIDKSAINDIYSDLGVYVEEDNTNYDFISVKMYALLFRILYNATYLNRAMSESILEILNETNVDEGIAKSLPNDLPVAHKYRIRNIGLKGNLQIESHDCGVVYYPDHPYVLCVMAMGSNANIINDFFNQISMTIYADMNSRYQIKKVQ